MELKSYIKHRKSIDKDFSEKKLAEMIGVNYSYFSRICNYKSCPSIQMAIDIEKATCGVVSGWELLKKCFQIQKEKKNEAMAVSKKSF